MSFLQSDTLFSNTMFILKLFACHSALIALLYIHVHGYLIKKKTYLYLTVGSVEKSENHKFICSTAFYLSCHTSVSNRKALHCAIQ